MTVRELIATLNTISNRDLPVVIPTMEGLQYVERVEVVTLSYSALGAPNTMLSDTMLSAGSLNDSIPACILDYE